MPPIPMQPYKTQLGDHVIVVYAKTAREATVRAKMRAIEMIVNGKIQLPKVRLVEGENYPGITGGLVFGD